MVAREELDELLAEDEGPAMPATRAPSGLRGWALIALMLTLLGAGTLLGAAVVLREIGIGGAPSVHGCDGRISGGLGLLILSGLLVGMARVVVDRRFAHPATFDAVRLAVLLPVPAIAVTITAPGMLGCPGAGRLDHMGRVGQSLLGVPGMAVASAAAFGIGLAVAGSVRVQPSIQSILDTYAPRADDIGPIDLEDANTAVVERVLADERDATMPLGPVSAVESPGDEDE